jgi:hypothetical protein
MLWPFLCPLSLSLSIDADHYKGQYSEYCQEQQIQPDTCQALPDQAKLTQYHGENGT